MGNKNTVQKATLKKESIFKACFRNSGHVGNIDWHRRCQVSLPILFIRSHSPDVQTKC